ncbi:hypothetical protein SAMN04490244_101258 [Tranquillimonas rosea]|uniref:DUF6950 domain-containing protein n=1 Tax=Tranquillimonas rosea TaxID=641238 RepID=A0A1H9PMT6_9RHOB|nr:hypothetical protein [Tranquillimonas rosea]SER49504.1 hypothetical protein SAMN04490244_101258 [Tranquillimonas rosea]
MTIRPAEVFTAARREMRGPLVRGRHDCLTTACGVSAALFGRDPLASGRPAYDSFTGAMRIVARAGGWFAWSEAAFSASGMQRVAIPRTGDLCLVARPDARGGTTFGLCIRPGEYVAKSRRGFKMMDGDLMGAWRWA